MKIKDNFRYIGTSCSDCKYCYIDYDSYFDESEYYCFCDMEDEDKFLKKFSLARKNKDWDFFKNREIAKYEMNCYICNNWREK